MEPYKPQIIERSWRIYAHDNCPGTIFMSSSLWKSNNLKAVGAQNKLPHERHMTILTKPAEHVRTEGFSTEVACMFRETATVLQKGF